MKARALNSYYAKHYSPSTPLYTPKRDSNDEQTPFLKESDGHPGVLAYENSVKPTQPEPKRLHRYNLFYIAGGITVLLLLLIFSYAYDNCSFADVAVPWVCRKCRARLGACGEFAEAMP